MAFQPDPNARILTGTWSAVNSGGVTVFQSGATVVNPPVQFNGATLNIMSGATVSNVFFSNSGGYPRVNVSAGGVLTSSYIREGYFTVFSGGKSISNDIESNTAIVMSGGSSVEDRLFNINRPVNGFWVSSGGTIISPVVGSGASLGAYPGSIVGGQPSVTGGVVVFNGATVGNGEIPDSLVFAPNATVVTGNWSAVLSDGKTVYQSGTVTLTGPIRISGGNLTVTSGAVASGVYLQYVPLQWPRVDIQAGGTLVSSYVQNGGVFVSAGGLVSASTLDSDSGIVYSGGSAISNTYNNTAFDNSNVRVLSGGVMSSPFITTGGIVQVNQGTVVNPTVNGNGYLGITSGQMITCFLRGTLITTSLGDIPVEEIKEGDLVTTYDSMGRVTGVQRVIWIHSSHVEVPLFDDRSASYPVRIMRSAFSEGCPARDMWVTDEHCFVFKGRLVPVRMLVNQTTIAYDKRLSRYDYFHIKLEKHSIIQAEHVLTESFLDSNNLENGGEFCKSFVPPVPALPLGVERCFVEPIYRELEGRGLGLTGHSPASLNPSIEDAGLYLETDDGRRIKPLRRKGNWHVFMVPADLRNLHLVSRVFKPSEAIGPFLDDQRLLGVLVQDIVIYDSLQTTEIDIHITQSDLPGWDVPEKGKHRWTQGRANLPINHIPTETEFMLCIEVISGGPYPLGFGTSFHSFLQQGAPMMPPGQIADQQLRAAG
ncbi:Hint domain-containing protein [Asaia bogorensis]|uniref:Hint domain-containing protein n=1 Tax=Asaia bogorensis TaxID=91915 RepID=UPI0030174D4D